MRHRSDGTTLIWRGLKIPKAKVIRDILLINGVTIVTRKLALICIQLCLLVSYAQVKTNAAGEEDKKVKTVGTQVSSSSTDSNEKPAVPVLDRVLLAISTKDYPVTPGDVYRMSFYRAAQFETVSLIVDGNMNVNLGFQGKLDASGMKFRDLKEFVERKMSEAYPGSNPLVTISSTGMFKVAIDGEVKESGEHIVWGLTQLADLVDECRTEYTTNRDVVIIDGKGKTTHYDLFQAKRNGKVDQNPYIKPGDLIRLKRSERDISVEGAVRRPGTYQLLSNEGFQEAILIYADGLTIDANPNRIEVIHKAPDGVGIGQKVEISFENASATRINDQDRIVVTSVNELLPVVYFEGALGVGIDGAQLQSANRIPYTYLAGEKLSQATRAMKDQFSAVSNLSNSYLVRDGIRRPIDLGKILYDKDFAQDFSLLPADIIVIPFRQFFVTVSGAVKEPGRYPYVPDRTWEYYINLAGGFDKSLNSGNKIDIIDVESKRWQKQRMIEPEDTIVAASNSFFYYFGYVAPLVSTLASVLSVITVVYSFTK